MRAYRNPIPTPHQRPVCPECDSYLRPISHSASPKGYGWTGRYRREGPFCSKRCAASFGIRKHVEESVLTPDAERDIEDRMAAALTRDRRYVSRRYPEGDEPPSP